MIKPLLLALALASGGFAAGLRGLVIDAASGTPIAAADITVRAASTGEIVARTWSDDAGTFIASDIHDSRVKVEATKDGYLNLHPVVIALSANRVVAVPLIRAGAISGKVLDATGKPLRGALVLAIVRRRDRGRMRLVPEGHRANADDRGMFRIYDLPPGHYAIEVLPPDDVAWNVTAFPAVFSTSPADPDRAELFYVPPGETHQLADLLVIPRPVHTVAGTVAGIPDAWAGKPVTVAAFPVGTSPGDSPSSAALADKSGHFSLTEVPDGSYTLAAFGPTVNIVDVPTHYAPEGRLQGSAPIDVASDLDKVEVTLRGLATLEGRVNSSEPECLAGVHVQLDSLDPTPVIQPTNSTVSAAGAFTIGNIPEGRYVVSVTGLPSDADGACWLRSIRWKDHDTADRVIQVDGNARLDLLVSRETGSVSGTAHGGDLVLALPLEGMGTVVTDTPLQQPVDADGHFRFDRIPTGRYRFVLLDGKSGNDYLDPTVWASSTATIVDVTASATPVDVALTRKPQ